MSILNRPSDGLFNVVVPLVRALVELGPLPKEKLLALCAPTTLGADDQDMAGKTLRRWTQIGLFIDDPETEKVKLAPQLALHLDKRSYSLDALAANIRFLIYLDSNNERFWDSEKNQSADFCRISAWMLAQDVYECCYSGFNEPETLYGKQLSTEDKIFQNDTRWSGFKSWSDFLGFGATDKSGHYTIDPTRAVRRELLELLRQGKSEPIKPVVEGLAERIPVIDGGKYRKLVESRMGDEHWRRPREGELSTSLSRVLLRLREAGYIRFENLSDASVRLVLIGRKHRSLETITHLQRGNVK